MTVVISLDGPPTCTTASGASRAASIASREGCMALQREPRVPHLIARSVVQRANHARLSQTIEAAHRLGVDQLSFLAADVSSTAFNRPDGWTAERRADVALSPDLVLALEASIHDVRDRCATHAEERIRRGRTRLAAAHSCVLRGARRARAISPRPLQRAVGLRRRRGGRGHASVLLSAALHRLPPSGLAGNAQRPQSVAFRASLDVSTNETCQRCVCSLSLAPLADV